MSYHLIMTDAHRSATDTGEKSFSGGYLNYIPQTPPEYRGLTISHTQASPSDSSRVSPGGGLLNDLHIAHFRGDGWADQEIEWAVSQGVQSITVGDAGTILGFKPPSGGILFPFTWACPDLRHRLSVQFAQVRLDKRYYYNYNTEEKIELGKYVHREGEIDRDALWMPPGVTKPSQLAAITEGWKDGALPFIRQGVAVGAIPGVGLLSRIMPKGCGVPVVFDSDAWINVQVMSDLIKGGLHNRGRVAIVPGEPTAKRGLTEFVNDGGDVAKLLESAKTPKALFLDWLEYLLVNPLQPIKNTDSPAHLYRRVLKIAKRLRMGKAIKEEWCKQHWAAYKTALNAKLQAQQVIGYGDAPRGDFEPLQMAPHGQRKLSALNGQMGTGKSSKAILGAVVDAMRTEWARVLWIVPSRSLAETTARSLERLLAKHGIFTTVSCHLDDKILNDRLLVTCPESLHQVPDVNYRLVIGDEINEWLPRILMGTLGKAPKAARAALVDRLQRAGHIILANDGIYKPVLDCIQRLSGIPQADTEIISRRRPTRPMAVRIYQGDAYSAWLKGQADALENGQRLVLPSGGQKNLRLRERWFATRGQTALTVIDRPDTDAALRSELLINPGKWAETSQDSLGYSPTISSGASIEVDAFDGQHEYIAGAETASAALQRGSRVRTALGGGKIDTRHIFIQSRGMPTQPHSMPMETFYSDFWATAIGQPKGTLEALLSPLGLGEVGKAADKGHVAPIDEFPELAEMLAIQAREIHLKLECLRAEFSLCGWTVEDAQPLDTEISKGILAEVAAIREILLEEESQTYTKAPRIADAPTVCPEAWERYAKNGEPATPLEHRYFDAWAVEQKTGAITHLANPEFWAACRLDCPQFINQAILRMTVELAIQHPDQFAEWRQWAALRAVATVSTDLPVSPRIMERAALISQCPGVAQVLDDTLTQWDMNAPVLQSAHRWTVANAERLAQTTAHSQRIYGLQFTPKTPTVKALHKILGELGISVESSGERGKVAQYRPQTVADIEALIERAAKANQDTANLERQAYRLEEMPNIVEAVRAVAMRKSELWADTMPGLVEVLSPAENFSKGDSILTEVLRTPSEPTPAAPFRLGERVRKRGKLDLAGIFQRVNRAGSALVRWACDATDSLVSLSDLEALA